MKWRVLIRPRAETDLTTAQNWYEKQKSGLGSEFREEISQCVRILEEHPERRPIYYRDFRRLLTRRFPYRIFYRIEGKVVVVFRVLHVRRDYPRQLGRS